MDTRFWAYLEEWRRRFPRRRKLAWREGWLENGYCADCCYCCGPQDSNEPFPMGLLPGQLRPGMAEDFYLLNADTAYMDARGCRACTAHGCRLPRPQRPVACGLFPLVLNAGGMYVYRTCPAVLFTPLNELAELGRQAARWLQGFPRRDLEHIALNLPEAVLAERYISLSLPVCPADAGAAAAVSGAAAQAHEGPALPPRASLPSDKA
ncbi:hypothetical protein [Desulfovibrio legallii]|jgi:hypothetical protein|uniref:Uncharacterized protein n=1 Tax=Desulfovibrio legallii TaxID=571438 RepID=A0A1G7N176_9BACT|nr:hypothetical protein [Desulfovibrio legallii]SDF67681.1 hypothetical protein SAMN05192586_11059 [Desulfovibrio legallii]